MVDEEADVIVGTYEDYVVGYRVHEADENPRKKRKSADIQDRKSDSSKLRLPTLEQTFAVRIHSGSVRCIATSPDGSLALSAGVDEMVNLLSLKKRKLLQTSEAPVTCAAFVESSHAICGLEDGDIRVYECKGSAMTVAKTLKGHKAAVTSISVHPSNKLMLSLSKDNTMRTWNLIKGRCAYVTCVRSQAHLVCWSKNGEHFLIAANNEIYLYNNMGALENSVKLDKRVNWVDFITDSTMVVASDSGKLEFFDIKSGESLSSFTAHESRIKSVKVLDSTDSKVRFSTISSDGTIKLWLVHQEGASEPTEQASADTGARLTCMSSAIRATS